MKFKVGDYVRIAIPEENDTKYARAGVTNQDIGEVTKVSSHLLSINWLTGTYVATHGLIWSGHSKEMKHAYISNQKFIGMLRHD